MGNNSNGSVLRNAVGIFFPDMKEPAPEYVQDLIPLVDISGGMYIVKGKPKNRYLKVVQVSATNYALKNNSEQNMIVGTFLSWLRIAPASCQLKIITHPEYEIPFVERLKEKAAACEDPVKKTIMLSNIEFIENESQNDASETEYYLIMEYERPKRTGEAEETVEQIAGKMHAIAAQARDYFAAMGNDFIQHSDEDMWLGELLYRILNPITSLTVPYKERAIRVMNDVLEAQKKKGIELEYPDTDYVNLVSPMGIDMKASSKCVIFDRTYSAYYYITSSGYPLEVESTWLSDLYSGMPGINIDIFFRKLNKKKFINSLVQVKKLTGLKLQSRTDNSTDIEDVLTAADSQDYMKAALQNRQSPQDPYNVVSIITVQADNYEELLQKMDRVEELANINTIKISDMRRHSWDGFISTLPFNDVSKKVFNKAKRNVTTEGLAGFYPFTAYKLNDPKGIFLGINTSNRSICTFDPSDSKKYSNANILVFGGSGRGKTYTMALFAERNVLIDNQVFIITSEKPHEFQRLCNHLQGKFIRFGTSNNQNINRFDILPQSDKRQKLYGETEAESWLIEKLKSLSAWYELLFKQLDEVELTVLDRATREAYAAKGITEDNDTIYIDNDPQTKKLKPMPIISDVVDSLARLRDAGENVPEKLFTLLTNFINGTYAGFNAPTNVELDTDFIVFDISKVPDRIEAATVQAALDFIWSKVKEDPTRNKTIVIEEGWKYISKGASEAAAKQIQEIFKVIRGYGGSVILATQEIEDLLASEYGQSLLSLSSIKILLGVEDGRSVIFESALRMQHEDAVKLESYNDGACFLMAGSDHLTLQIQASPFEDQLITTDKRQLQDIYESKENNTN